MEKYQYDISELKVLEGMWQPLAVFQLIDGERTTPLILSEGFCQLFGYTDKVQAYQEMEHNAYRGIHPDDFARITRAVARVGKEGGSYEVIFRSKTKNSCDYRIIHSAGKFLVTETGSRLLHIWYMDEGLYSEGSDPEGSGISRSLSFALHEESILNTIQYDQLTGLPNMTFFFELADSSEQDILKEGGRPTILFADFSGMKFFNTKHGFAEGDRLLKAFAKKLEAYFGNRRCCHIGADHFAVVADDSGLEEKLDRLLLDCRSMNEGRTIPVHIGIYQSQQEGVHISVACDRAKLACNSLRGSYDSGYHYYTRELSQKAFRRLYILENFERALAEKWIKVFYQPIVRATTGSISDEEALSRWIDPQKGVMSPADFIPVLEDARMIHRLDLYVVEQIIEKIRILMSEGLPVVPQSVNLSRYDFDSCDIVEEIRSRVDAAGIARDRITIEITESVIGSDIDFIKEQILRFQKLGFPVWMDDFGSGYSSLDVLQSIKFNLIKFDMSFMKKLDEGGSGKIVLTELMRMATSLRVDTVCEGVETAEQVSFLQEIGCSKLQGFYFSKPTPFEVVLKRQKNNPNFRYEDSRESSYFETIGKVNLYDLSVIANDSDGSLQNAFNTIPMGIIEIRGDSARFVRNNKSYRDFMKRFFHFDLSFEGASFSKYDATFMFNIVKNCCERGARAFYDEKMPDGSVVHSFARKIDTNPVTGDIAVAVAVLSITDPSESTTYADIARSLASDYYSIYAVDLDTGQFIEYSSQVGREGMAMERHGKDFFEVTRRDSKVRIYEEDREFFDDWFTKENIIRELEQNGVYRATYRLIDSGTPVYASMKITWMNPGGNRIIIGISIVDSQVKQREHLNRMIRERDTLARIMALSDDYLSLYTIIPDTGFYVEYNSTQEYSSLGFKKKGEDFFSQGLIDCGKVVLTEDLPYFKEKFNKETILDEIREHGRFKLQYRMIIGGEVRPVTLKIAPFHEGGEEKLVAGVRAWKTRSARPLSRSAARK